MIPSPEMNSLMARTPASHCRATISRIALASAATSIRPPSDAECARLGDHRPARHDARAGHQAAIDEVLGQHVVVGLEDAGPDDEGVTALEEGPGHRSHVEDVALRRGRRHPVVVEDEVERPADVGVGVAQAGQDRGAARGRPPGPPASSTSRRPRDTAAIRFPSMRTSPSWGRSSAPPRAGEDPGVPQQCPVRHVSSYHRGRASARCRRTSRCKRVLTCGEASRAPERRPPGT